MNKKTQQYKVFIKDLVVQAPIGMLEHEIGVKQPLHVNASFLIDGLNPVNDDIGTVLDYREIRQLIIDECTKEHTHLLETLIQRLANRLLNAFPAILNVHLSLEKPEAFDDCYSVGLEVSLEQPNKVGT